MAVRIGDIIRKIKKVYESGIAFEPELPVPGRLNGIPRFGLIFIKTIEIIFQMFKIKNTKKVL